MENELDNASEVIEKERINGVLLVGLIAVVILILILVFHDMTHTRYVYERMNGAMELATRKIDFTDNMRDTIYSRGHILQHFELFNDEAARQEEIGEFRLLSQKFLTSLNEMNALSLDQKEQVLLRPVSERARVTEPKIAAAIQLAINSNSNVEIDTFIEQVGEYQSNQLRELNKLSEYQKSVSADGLFEAKRIYESGRQRIAYTAIVIVVLTLFIAASLFKFVQARNKLLLNSNRKIRDMTKVKSDFFATMTHEIRTPMNGVLGMADLLQNTPLNAQQKGYVDSLVKSGEILLAIINDILDFSKIEAGKLELVKDEFDLRKQIDELMALLSARAEEKGIDLRVEIAGDVPSLVRGDRTRITQILLNLVGNAIKFTDSGKVVLRIGCNTFVKGNVRLRFEVIDTGKGISNADQTRLFQEFSQVVGSFSHSHPGTGLGLAISRRLVNLMKGQIGVHSEVGHGSNFWFVLPLGIVAKSASTEETSLQGKQCIFVMESERVSGFRDAVAERGAAVKCYDSLDQLFMAISQAVLDLDAVDMIVVGKSPNNDAVRLVRELRKGHRLNYTKSIAVLAGPSVIEKRFFEDYADLVLDEHLKPEELTAKFTEYFQGMDEKSKNSNSNAFDETMTNDKTYKILVAEDNVVNQKVVQGMLARLSFDVELVANGQEAVDAVLAKKYDVVIMDCQMPVLDGYAATGVIRRLVEEKKLEDLPIIALTANAMIGDREKCLKAGMDDFLPKPITLETLEPVMRKWVEGDYQTLKKSGPV